MRNSFGNRISLTLWGESHGPAIGGILDGLPGGIKVEEAYLKELLDRRKGDPVYSTKRQEEDQFMFLSGIKEGITTGAPISVRIDNKDVRSEDYSALNNKARPSHIDFGLHEKEQGFEERIGGGHFSGRLTAPLVVLGGIVKKALEKKGIQIRSSIDLIGGVPLKEAADLLKEAKEKGDSLGGLVSVSVTGVEPGLGNPWFENLESKISSGIFSIPGIKGISFGSGSDFSRCFGHEMNDELKWEKGKVCSSSNHNGGIAGGITTGMPIEFQVIIRPTPSIARIQNTVDLYTKENTQIEIKGRHDVCFALRMPVILETMTALVLGDELTIKYGEDYLR